MNKESRKKNKRMWLAMGVFVILLLTILSVQSILADPMAVAPFYLPIVYQGEQITPTPTVGPGAEYVVIGWNDLGMHCYDRDYSKLSVLPPYNNLWAQVIQRGDPPQVVTQGVRVQYAFPDNTSSATKTNFWTYAPE